MKRRIENYTGMLLLTRDDDARATEMADVLTFILGREKHRRIQYHRNTPRVGGSSVFGCAALS
jgi:hypothetical protein